MMRIAVCDDDEIQLELLKEYVFEIGKEIFHTCQVIGFQEGERLLSQPSSFDLVMLDVHMNGLDGFEVSKKLKELYPNQIIIFVTSDFEQVYDSFQHQAFDFVRKRDSFLIKQDIRTVLHRVKEHRGRKDYIMILSVDGKTHKIHYNQIIKMESKKNYIHYHIDDNEVIIERKALVAIGEILKGNGFVKVNKGTYVNLNFVEWIDRKERWAYGKKLGKVEVSKSYEKSLMGSYMDFLGS